MSIMPVLGKRHQDRSVLSKSVYKKCEVVLLDVLNLASKSSILLTRTDRHGPDNWKCVHG